MSWHPTRNGTLTPETVHYGSHQKLWWQCEKGHEWQAEVKSRASGCGCPVCAGRKVLSGENDLATTNPDLAAQWDPVKNGALRPSDVTAGSHRSVWWKCGKGHEWKARILSRSTGAGCPYCAGKRVIPGETDLASQFPELSAFWNRERNGTLSPESVSVNSNRKVWWQCEKGHEWQAQVASMTRMNRACPYCNGRKVWPGFNDLATVDPKIAAQWHPTLNGTLRPDRIRTGSHKKVWWICSEGHVWKAAVFSRTGKQRCGCPVCAGMVKSHTIRYERWEKIS